MSSLAVDLAVHVEIFFFFFFFVFFFFCAVSVSVIIANQNAKYVKYVLADAGSAFQVTDKVLKDRSLFLHL